jgi:hypothetical protein
MSCAALKREENNVERMRRRLALRDLPMGLFLLGETYCFTSLAPHVTQRTPSVHRRRATCSMHSSLLLKVLLNVYSDSFGTYQFSRTEV